MSAEKESLVEKGQRENRQEFETTPTVMELQYLFRIICQELTSYTIWPVS